MTNKPTFTFEAPTGGKDYAGLAPSSGSKAGLAGYRRFDDEDDTSKGADFAEATSSSG